MTLEEFVEKYSYSPIGMENVAYEATKVEDNPAFKEAATKYLDSMQAFEDLLDEVGFEFG